MASVCSLLLGPGTWAFVPPRYCFRLSEYKVWPGVQYAASSATDRRSVQPCNDPIENRQPIDVPATVTDPPPRRLDTPLSRRLAEFERLYRAEFVAVASFFARRSYDPQLVADLTADTFVGAMQSYDTFDPVKGSSRAWILGIARRIYAKHCESSVRRQDAARRISAQRLLDPEEIEELMRRIDAERAARKVIQGLSHLSALERAAIELVHLAGLTPSEAAQSLEISSGALRVRLLRARARLRAENGGAVDGADD
jgi:RNA polymerase sigma factor (sigma-70 family)